MANMANPEQAARARQEMGDLPANRTVPQQGKNRMTNIRRLSKFEREALDTPVDEIFVYNISPIFKWQKDFPGLGTMTLFPRKASQEYSDPVVFSRRVIRTYDGGNRIQRLMVETPLEIVQDFLCCSPDFPGRPENNLQEYGCFYTVGKPLEDFPEAERQKILDDAELKHVNRLHQKVAEADALANSPNMQACIVEVHKKAALYLHEERKWVAQRGALNPTDECVFCGFPNKRNIAKCSNCKEIINPALYKEIQEKIKSEAKSKLPA